MMRARRLVIAATWVICAALAAACSEEPASKPSGPPPQPPGPKADLPNGLKAALENGSLELISVLNDEGPLSDAARSVKTLGDFHGSPILGRTSVDAGAKGPIVSALLNGLEPLGPGVPRPACFFPRHGVRASHEGKTYELVICFQCIQAKLYEGTEQKSVTFLIGKGPEKAFDTVLKAAGIPLSRDFER